MSAAAQHISPLCVCVCVCVEFILCTFGTSLKSIKEREATQKSKQKSVSCSEGRLSATAAAAASARCCCCYTLPWPVARTFQPQIATGIDKAMAKQQQQKSSNNNKLHLVAPHEKAAGNTQNSRTHIQTHTQSETIYKGLCTVPFPFPRLPRSPGTPFALAGLKELRMLATGVDCSAKKRRCVKNSTRPRPAAAPQWRRAAQRSDAVRFASVC